VTNEQIIQAILDIPDEVLSQIALSSPWQYDPDGISEGRTERDADGFRATGSAASDRSLDAFTRKELQDECWVKFGGATDWPRFQRDEQQQADTGFCG